MGILTEIFDKPIYIKDKHGNILQADAKIPTKKPLKPGSGASEPKGKKSLTVDKGLLSTVQSAGEWLAKKWHQLEARYGRKAALAMAVGMIATFPLPGNITAIVAAAEAIRGLHGFLSKQGPAFVEEMRARVEKSIVSKAEGWVTMEGTHVHLDDKGTIDAGPPNIEGKPVNNLPPREETVPAANEGPANNLPKDESPKKVEVKEVPLAERQVWAKGLSPKHKKAVASWTNGNQYAVRSWQSGKAFGHSEHRKKAEAFEAAMAKAPKYEGPVYRGLESIDPKNTFSEYVPGAIVSLDASASSSKDVETATTFLGDDKGRSRVLLEFRQKTGADISTAAEKSYQHQREVVVPKGAKYRVVNVEEKEVDQYPFGFNKDRGETPASQVAREWKTPSKKIKVKYVVMEEET